MFQRALKPVAVAITVAAAIALLALASPGWLSLGAGRNSAAWAAAPRDASMPSAPVASPVAPAFSTTDNGARGATLAKRSYPSASMEMLPTDLAGLAVGHADPRVRQEALHWLGEAGGLVAIQTARQALFDADLAVRRGAVRSLARMGGEAAEQSLVPMLQASEAALRLETLDALALMNPRLARAQLEMLLLDGDPAVREAAAEWQAEIARAD